MSQVPPDRVIGILRASSLMIGRSRDRNGSARAAQAQVPDLFRQQTSGERPRASGSHRRDCDSSHESRRDDVTAFARTTAYAGAAAGAIRMSVAESGTSDRRSSTPERATGSDDPSVLKKTKNAIAKTIRTTTADRHPRFLFTGCRTSGSDLIDAIPWSSAVF